MNEYEIGPVGLYRERLNFEREKLAAEETNHDEKSDQRMIEIKVNNEREMDLFQMMLNFSRAL